MTPFALLLAVFCVLSTTSLALPNPGLPLHSQCSSTRIIGGYQANITDIPFQVSLQTEFYGHFCGGSVISSRWVLSAAHCAANSDNAAFDVRVRSSLSGEGGQLVPVKRVLHHPQFVSETLDYDFALLELGEELQLDDQFYAVELPEQDEPVRDGTCLQVSGWGATYGRDHELKAANIPAVNQDECAQAYEWFGTVTSRMLCAGYEVGGNNACHGDSGGPLVDGSKLVGVVSWSFGCAARDYPTVYARVAAVRSWVRETSGV